MQPTTLRLEDDGQQQELDFAMSQNSFRQHQKRPLLVILLVLISVVACGAAGYSWWLLQQHKNGSNRPPPNSNRRPRGVRHLCPSTWHQL